MDLTGSGCGPMVGSRDFSDEPSGSCTTELVNCYADLDLNPFSLEDAD
jgi:hypothetical protein